jgi:hypothetical protein
MDLQKLIKWHRHEIEYWRRLHANPAAEFHREAAQLLEFLRHRLDDAIKWGDTCANCRSD